MASASLKSSIKMGAEIRLTTYLEETITGEVEAYDAQNDLVVIKSYVSPKCYDYHVVNLTYVTLERVNEPDPALVEANRPSIDISKARDRAAREIEKKICEAKRRANPDADRRARAVFQAVDKILKCEWMKNDIDVLDGAAVIRAPFSSDCVEGEPRTVAQVRKILSKLSSTIE
ncbi:protein LSM12-like [Oscarella lobularis]|uniref:protein LSM12-like n=1 Tax=Oscarella lobularis TaxID=121494 RepID=UPI0033144EFF